jgi:hypothetical protein
LPQSEELNLGATRANVQVAAFLQAAAKSGNVTVQILDQSQSALERNLSAPTM